MITLIPFLLALAVLLVVGVTPFVGPFVLLLSLSLLVLWGMWKASASALTATGENVLRRAQASELFGRGGADDPDFTLVPSRRRLAEGNGASDRPVLTSPDGAARHERRAYAVPARLPLNHWALAGEWTIGRENVLLDQAGGSIAFRFHARDAHLVLSSGARDPIPFRVLLDGEAPGPRTALTSTLTGTACSSTAGCTSSSASKTTFASGRSRSRSSSRESRRMPSPSARAARERRPPA